MKRRNVSALAGGLVIVLVAVTMAFAGLSANAASEKQEAVSRKITTVAAGNREEAANLAEKNAGISAYIGNATGMASAKEDGAGKTAETETAANVAASVEAQKAAATAAEKKEKAEAWKNRAIASNVQEYVYVRDGASEDSAPVGRLPRGGAGDVIEKGQEWTKISSGQVEGYVSNSYLAFGEEALEVAEEVCDYVATVEADQVSIRETPEAESQILQTVSTGDEFSVVEEGKDWVKVVSQECVGYMSKIVVDVKLDLGVATPIEPEPSEEPEKSDGQGSAETGSEAPETDAGNSQESGSATENSGESQQKAEEPSEEPEQEVSSGSAASHTDTFKVTAYCACSKCCGSHANGYTATGTRVTAGRTIAVDKNVIPLGTTVYINGVPYVAEDTGVHGKTIDLYMDSHSAALQWGVQYCTVSW